MTKREKREHLFIMLFQKEFHDEEALSEQMNRYCQELNGLTGPKKEALEKRIQDIISKVPELDQMIEEKSEGWNVRRFAKTDLTIIRLALYEILYDEEIPAGISINEAVELGKKYGGEKSSGFINAILAKFV